MSRWWRGLLRRFGPSAPRLAVRTALPRYWWILAGLLVGLLFWFGLGAALNSERSSPPSGQEGLQEEVSELRKKVKALGTEGEVLVKRAEAAEQQYRIEMSARRDLAAALQRVEAENARLREDMAFFQTQFSATSGVAPKIFRFQLEKSSDSGELHYLLVVAQSGRKPAEFVGDVQLVLQVDGKGGRRTVRVPERQGRDPRFTLKFRYYQRLEGNVSLEPDARVVQADALVFRQGERQPTLTRQASIDTRDLNVREETKQAAQPN